MESSILICGISEKTNFGNDITPGQFTAIFQKLSSIGASVRGYKVIQDLRNFDDEKKDFFMRFAVFSRNE